MGDAAEKLSGKLGIDTTDFKTGISAANRELRILESSFKAGAAALGDYTQSATGLESRIGSLTKQIDIQKLKVAALKEEHQRLVEANGANSRAAQDAEIKLNKETETLNKMELELGTTKSALDEMQQGEQAAGAAADGMGKEVATATAIIEGGELIVAGFTAAIGLAVAAIAALGAGAIAAIAGITDLVLNASDAGSQIQDMSDKTKISVERLQELGFIGKQIGTDLDTITGANARLIRSMFAAKDGTGAQADAFKELGVRTVDANGKLRDSQAVFGDVIDALGRVKNPAEADALAMEIFGKSAQELNPLIKLGSQGMAEMAKKAHDLGAVISDENVTALDAFDDRLTSLEDGLHGTFNTLAVSFLPIFDELANIFENNVMPVIQNFITLASQYLEPVIKNIVDIMKQFASGDTRGALGRMFGIENADAILNIISLVKDFLLNTLLPFFSGNSGDIGAGLLNVLSGILGITTALIKMGEIWISIWIKIHDATSVAVKGISNMWQGVFLPAIQRVWSFLQTNVFPIFQALGEFWGAVFGLEIRALSALWQNVLLPPLREVANVIRALLFPVFQAIGSYMANVFGPIIIGIGGFIRNYLIPAFHGIASAIASVVSWLRSMAGYLNNLALPDWLTPGSPTPWEIGLVGINNAMQELNQHLPRLSNNLNFAPALTPATAQGASGVKTNTTNNQNMTINIAATVRSQQDIDYLAQEVARRIAS